MRKFAKVFGFILSVSVASFLAACSSDNEVKYVEFDESLQSGLTINLEGGVYTLDVKSNDTWTVSLPEDCDWAMLLTESGKGNGEVLLSVDENNTGVTRYVDITLSSASGQSTIRFTQDDTLDGVAVNDLAYQSLIRNKGLGFGCNLAEFYNDASKNELTFSQNNVVNLNGISKYMDKNDYELVRISKVTNVTMEDAITDTVVAKRDSLGVKLNFQISYGLFKLGIHGAYHGGETMTSSTNAIRVAANYPTLEASLSDQDVMAIYTDWASEGTKESGDLRGSLLSPGFISKMNALNKAVSDTSKSSDAAVTRACRNIVTAYGTGVAVSSKLGGMAAIELFADKKKIAEILHVDTAKLTVAFSSGTLNIDADAEVTYQSDATTVLNSNSFALSMKGGDAEIINNIFLEASKDSVYNFRQLVVDWANSLTNGKDDKGTGANVEVISAELVPIWQFFDGEAQDALIDYIADKYKNTPFVRDFLDMEIESDKTSSTASKTRRRK